MKSWLPPRTRSSFGRFSVSASSTFSFSSAAWRCRCTSFCRLSPSSSARCSSSINAVFRSLSARSFLRPSCVVPALALLAGSRATRRGYNNIYHH